MMFHAEPTDLTPHIHNTTHIQQHTYAPPHKHNQHNTHTTPDIYNTTFIKNYTYTHTKTRAHCYCIIT